LASSEAGIARHLLDTWYLREPVDGDQILEKRVQLVHLGNRRLQTDGHVIWIDAGCEVVEHNTASVFRELREGSAIGPGGQHVKIGYDQDGVVL
jgi:hypothetical protein